MSVHEEKRGIACPGCGSFYHKVLWTRAALLKRTARRRECRHCGKRWTTYEK